MKIWCCDKEWFSTIFSLWASWNLATIKMERMQNVTFTWDWHWKEAVWQRFTEPIHQRPGNLLRAIVTSGRPCQPPPCSSATLAAKVDTCPGGLPCSISGLQEKPASGIVPLKGRYSRMSMEWIWVSEHMRSSEQILQWTLLLFVLLFQLLRRLQHQTVNRTYFPNGLFDVST